MTEKNKKSPLAMILGDENIFSPTVDVGPATATLDRPANIPPTIIVPTLAATPPHDAAPLRATTAAHSPPLSHLPPPIPCILCDTPVIWESVYSTPTAPQFGCIECDPPPAAALVRARWWLILLSGPYAPSPSVEQWIWAPLFKGPEYLIEQQVERSQQQTERSERPQQRNPALAALSPADRIVATWDRFWNHPRLITSVELEWLDEGRSRIKSRTWTIAPLGKIGDEMLAAAREWAKQTKRPADHRPAPRKAS